MISNNEAVAWREVPQGWRQLWGDFDRLGVALQWHDFRTERALDWGLSFRPRSLEFCLNVAGRGAVGDRADYVPSSAGYYAVADEPLHASRQARDRHQFVTVEFSNHRLQAQLADCEGDLDPQLRAAIFPDKQRSIVSTARPMTPEQHQVVSSLLAPPVSKAAQSLWYQSKALELMSHFLFTPKDPEFFCMRQKRVARDRVERTKELLARDLANPPTLEMLGREVGCSPFYLSRSFSREVGLTIPQYLRKLRMERAAELLRSGRYNVTEAATEVGYASLSHFSKAFCETIGCCPVLYPMAKNVIAD
ncbi:MAG TPA: AraC family transcriptional regulator [Chthoniobacterales bacterium]|jgi:AraC-like DNA-binding protein|nr:AraC family transcriptional regulator [Chthoniobacterales bacterium]